MFLPLPGLQRHHETLHALGLVVQSLDLGREIRQQTVADLFKFDIRQQRPWQHIHTLRHNGANGLLGLCTPGPLPATPAGIGELS